MSDDENDVDIYSDDESEDSMSDSKRGDTLKDSQYSKAEKRAHHNALERKRRDHLKDSFAVLRERLPTLKPGQTASRICILQEAADYIERIRCKNSSHQQDIEDLVRQNTLLEAQIRRLERK